MGIESENLFTGSAFAEDEQRNVGTGDQCGLGFQITHPFAGANERMGLVQRNLPHGLGSGLLVLVGVNVGQMLFDGLLDVASEERFHHDGTNAEANHHLQVAKLG